MIPLRQEQFALPDGSRIGEYTVLHKMNIPGGCGFWLDDMTSLDRLNAQLAEAKETPAEQAELTRLRAERPPCFADRQKIQSRCLRRQDCMFFA